MFIYSEWCGMANSLCHASLSDWYKILLEILQRMDG